MNYELQKKKITYIPMFARGEISERECARLIGITPMSAWRLKNRYLQFGKFIYHGYEFKLLAPKVSCVKFTLCLSESFGLRAYFCGKYYNVELCEPLCDVVGDTMPIVEKI